MSLLYPVTGNLHFLGVDVPIALNIKASSTEEAKALFPKMFSEFKRLGEIRRHFSISLHQSVDSLFPQGADSAALICIRDIKCLSKEEILSRATPLPPKKEEIAFDPVFCSTSDSSVEADGVYLKNKTTHVSRYHSVSMPLDLDTEPEQKPRTYKIKIRNHEPVAVDETPNLKFL
jgi:hypothetical protein